MKRLMLISLLSCMVVGQVYCQDVSAFAFGAATPVLAASATAGVAWAAGSCIGMPGEAAALGAVGAIVLYDRCLGRDENESVSAYARTFDIIAPTLVPAVRMSQAQAAYQGEKYAKIGVAGVALYLFCDAVYSKLMSPNR